jgi:hypothetical protein
MSVHFDMLVLNMHEKCFIGSQAANQQQPTTTNNSQPTTTITGLVI